jgi:hypothetical protein
MSRVRKRRRFTPLFTPDEPLDRPFDFPAEDDDGGTSKTDAGETTVSFSEGETLPPDYRDFSSAQFEFVEGSYEEVIANIPLDTEESEAQFEFVEGSYEEVVVSEEPPTEESTASFAFVEGAYISAVAVENLDETSEMDATLDVVNHRDSVESPGLTSETAEMDIGFNGGTYS